MIYTREVALSFRSRSEEDLNEVTEEIDKIVQEHLNKISVVKVSTRIIRNGFIPEKTD